MARAFCSLIMIIFAAVFHHLFVTLTLAQNFCNRINVSNETAGSPPMDMDYGDEVFYLNINNSAPCSGRIASWKVCYHGPMNPEKKYEIVYAIYRRTTSRSDDSTFYDKVSDTFSTTLKRSDNSDDNDGDGDSSSRSTTSSKSRRSASSSRSSRTYPPLYVGFHCYVDEVPDNDNSPIIQAGDFIGACVNNPTMSMEERLNIIGVVNSSENSAVFHTTMSGRNKCRSKGGKTIPSNIPFHELSILNSTRLHLYVDISKYSFHD